MTTAAPDRVDLFSLIHEGLRPRLFDTALLLGRTDFSLADDVARARQAVARCFDLLREHAEHEDRHIVPALIRVAPALARAIGAEHVELEKAAIDIEALFPRLAVAEGAERQRLGRELFRRMNLLVADQLRHLEREE